MNERNVAAIHASLNGMSLVHAAREPGTTDEDLREAIAALLAADGVLHPKVITDMQAGDVPTEAPYGEERTFEQVAADVRAYLEGIAKGEKVDA